MAGREEPLREFAGCLPEWEFYPECNGKQRALSRRDSGSSLQVGELALAAVRSQDGAWG